MTRIEEYRRRLRELDDWDAFLLAESGLPGPRANLELAQAVGAEGNEARFRRYLAYGPTRAPTGTAAEFFALCGVVGFGHLLTEGRADLLAELRTLSSDPRWRIREGVAMALQHLGVHDMDALVSAMHSWAGGDRFAQRAAAAALSEPALLGHPGHVAEVLTILDRITSTVEAADDRDTYGFGVLRRCLGYCWSVAAVASPDEGLPRVERWCGSLDPDVRWIMRENLGKARLERIAPDWVSRWRQVLAPTRW